MDQEKLFKEFAPISKEQWEAQIIRDLKGGDYQKKLVWKNENGFDIQPYYRYEDTEPLRLKKDLPGIFPFRRGNSKAANPWKIRQDIVVDDVKEANEKALDILMKGVDSLGFDMSTQEVDYATLEELLKNIRMDIAEINLMHVKDQQKAILTLEELVRNYNRDPDLCYGSVLADPLGSYIRGDTPQKPDRESYSKLAQLIRKSGFIHRYKLLGVDAALFTNAGGTEVQSLAFSLAMGIEYLDKLTDEGLFAGDVAARMQFKLAIGNNYFMEMARIRASRLLWAKIVNAFGLSEAENARMHITAENSLLNKTLFDPHVNLLRNTTETMSAVIAGVDSFKVLPFDTILETPTAFGERLARNQQLLLREESYLDKVADPAGGSYFIEFLTAQLADQAWKQIMAIEEMGGFLEAFEKGWIQQQLQQSFDQKKQEVAKRKRILLGTNQYPSSQEKINTPETADEFSQASMDKYLRPSRLALDFEKLRLQTEAYSLEHERPGVWMFTYGNPAMRKARSSFATNLFACAGYRIIDNPGFSDINQGIEAASASEAQIIVICASDEDYESHVLEIYKALSGHKIIVLAGRPKDLTDTLQAAGMQHFIYAGMDVLAYLKSIHKLLGIAS